MAHVKIAADSLRRMRDELVKVAELEKRAEQLEAANRIYRETMDLVAEGSLDPAVAIEKVAEFQSDPIQLDIFKAAMKLGPTDTTKLGTAVDDTKQVSSDAGSPEGKLSRRIEKIAGDHDLRTL